MIAARVSKRPSLCLSPSSGSGRIASNTAVSFVTANLLGAQINVSQGRENTRRAFDGKQH